MKQLPKIELHCHLDGSVRAKTIYELAMKDNITLPTDIYEELSDYLVAPFDCDSLESYLKRFDIPISVMQTKDALTRITYELIEDHALENVKYLEIRFAPLSHLQKGLSLKDVIKSVLNGKSKAEKVYDIKVNIILGFMRHDSTDNLYELIRVGKDYIGKGLVAIDLCALETESFIRKFIKPIRVARDAGFKVTIHAGETGFPHNVVEAVEYLDATRIGHGVAIIHDEPSLEYIADSNVLLEVCPTSNIQTKAFSSYEEHPINEFLLRGVNFSIGTDNRTVSNVTLTDEYNMLVKTFGWNQEVFGKIFNMSIEASFAKKKTKQWLRDISQEFYGGSD